MMEAWNHLCSTSQEEGSRTWRAGTSGPECDFSALPNDVLTPQCSRSAQKVWLHSCLHRQHQTDCSRPSGKHASTYSDQSFMHIKNTSGKPIGRTPPNSFTLSFVPLSSYNTKTDWRFWDIMAHGDIWWQGCLWIIFDFLNPNVGKKNSDMYLKRTI